MDAGELGAMHHMLEFEALVEETDVVGNRARQQLVVLHYNTNALAKGLVPKDAQRHAVDQDFPRSWLQQTEDNFQQCRLPTTGWSGDSQIIAGSNVEFDVAEHEGLAFGVTEAKVTNL